MADWHEVAEILAEALDLVGIVVEKWKSGAGSSREPAEVESMITSLEAVVTAAKNARGHKPDLARARDEIQKTRAAVLSADEAADAELARRFGSTPTDKG